MAEGEGKSRGKTGSEYSQKVRGNRGTGAETRLEEAEEGYR